MHHWFRPIRQVDARLILFALCWFSASHAASATDYFLTLGGGYKASGNQASLEANVLFFQQVLTEKNPRPRVHTIYFADGTDAGPDLQVQVEKPAKSETPATDLLTTLHRRPGQVDVTYRNHAVPQIAGPLDPKLIRANLENLAKTARDGDRLILYVTAHGSEGPEGDPFNTTIDCWNERKITAREFTEWVNQLPPQVPVVMVMAQCYCGGFGRTIFRDLDPLKGLHPQIRVGFFAQQHHLPAAGCRPDIEHDQEFSSYFWGALAGRSRNGVPIEGCDIDKNGLVSFAEAYGYAVTAGETIDIPLRTSEIFLRAYSRLESAPDKATAKPNETSSTEPPSSPSTAADHKAPGIATKTSPSLAGMSGSLQTYVDRGRPVSGRIVTQLAKTLGFTLDDDVTVVKTAFEQHQRASRSIGRNPGRRQKSGRRDLLREIAEKWPELADDRKWKESSLLKLENQETLLTELQQLPGWKAYEERLKQREVASDKSEKHELRGVKFRRLIQALETILLEQNLATIATPEIIDRYQQIMALEESTLVPPTR